MTDSATRRRNRHAALAARAGETVRGPILAPLRCGCVVDSDGGVWAPCDNIFWDHAECVTMVRAGMDVNRAALAELLARIAGHVEAGERAAHGGTQEALL